MKNDNKGFTLIELLVVVAIIGSLAAVGVVAYNGYTKAAKENAAKSIHAGAVKYLAAEIAKCTLDENATIFDDTACSSLTGATAVSGFADKSTDKNPWTGADALDTDAVGTEAGTLYMIASDNDITVTMKYQKDEGEGDDKVTGKSLETEVTVE